MSTSYVESGRTNQKRRTYEALVVAARDLVAAGGVPTVEEAAAEAAVSRTTAYRYFPTRRALLVAAFPETAAASLLPQPASDDPVERLESVLEQLHTAVLATEPQYRAFLRLSLEATPEERRQLHLRQGRAIGWIKEALAPLEATLGSPAVHRLTLAVRATTGIEALVWLTDVAGLDRDDAVRLMRESARALVEHAREGGGRVRRSRRS